MFALVQDAADIILLDDNFSSVRGLECCDIQLAVSWTCSKAIDGMEQGRLAGALSCLRLLVACSRRLSVKFYLSGENLQKSIMYTLCSKLRLDKTDVSENNLMQESVHFVFFGFSNCFVFEACLLFISDRASGENKGEGSLLRPVDMAGPRQRP